MEREMATACCYPPAMDFPAQATENNDFLLRASEIDSQAEILFGHEY